MPLIATELMLRNEPSLSVSRCSKSSALLRLIRNGVLPSEVHRRQRRLYRKQFPLDLLLGRVSDFSAELLNPFFAAAAKVVARAGAGALIAVECFPRCSPSSAESRNRGENRQEDLRWRFLG
jgi:hypothetical protein